MVASILDSAPSWFCLLVIMSKQDFFNWDPVHFALCPLGSLSTWTLSSSESGHMTLSPPRVVSTIGSVNSGICSRLVLSTWDSGPNGCLSTLILTTPESGYMTFCPRRIVSTKGFVNSGFCLGLLLYILGVLPHDILPMYVRVYYWESVLSTLDCAHFWFCLMGSLSTWDFVYFDSVRSEVCSLS